MIKADFNHNAKAVSVSGLNHALSDFISVPFRLLYLTDHWY